MNRQHESKQAPDSQLRGTLASVLLLGAVIIAIWGGVFAIYALRS